MPSRAAAAAVCRQWLDWSAPTVITVSASSSSAAPIRNSSLRVLLPPVASPVQSSRLIQSCGPSSPESRAVSAGRGSNGVGAWQSAARG